MKKLKKLFEKYIHASHWVCFLIAIAFIFRIPSFFEPYSYGDEMIYLTLGEGIRHGFTLYKDIHDNKPPLLYYLAFISGNIFWFKVMLAFWASATIIFFWRLVESLFKNKLIIYASVVTFTILTTLPSFEGNIANAENFMIGFTILGFLILTQKKLSFNKIFIGGLLIGIATLFKMPALFDLGAISIYWFITIKKYNFKSIKKYVTKNIYLILGFVFPLIVTIIWFYLKGALNEYLVAAFGQNIGYLSSWRPSAQEKSFLVKNAPLLTRGLIVFIGFVILLFSKHKLSKPFILITAWSLTSIFAVTLSERPYPHYLIQSMPSFSILVGILIGANTIEQTLTVFPIFLTIFAPVYFKFWIYPTFNYYNNFFLYSTQKITKEEYLNKFDKNLTRDYKIAKYINLISKANENVFVFGGESARIYALSKRLPKYKYIASYHINDFSSYDDVYLNFLKNPPTVIAVTPDFTINNNLKNFITNNYILVQNIEEALIYKKVNLLNN